MIIKTSGTSDHLKGANISYLPDVYIKIISLFIRSHQTRATTLCSIFKFQYKYIIKKCKHNQSEQKNQAIAKCLVAGKVVTQSTLPAKYAKKEATMLDVATPAINLTK